MCSLNPFPMLLYQVLLDHCAIVSILFGIHLVCALFSLTFLVLCFLKKKFGSSYQILLHAYLLSILLMGLTSLFAVLYLPLSFLQQSHSLSEGQLSPIMSDVFWSSSGMLTLQFIQKNLVEQMLPLMESCFE
ncbi:unnamed protein product [Angiostrongylus costaricensis]|uniref:G_PROTEIN_RECEP_F1_2 domain-containing protein n=1 Tax=Angiostrongylus costaricensis TaxID=334426 RepID=A0A0R3PQJ9_ANGCS|nr:unnamed protein product [Angiostrongylus costaricensis]